ncbi:MAG TPA: hypothetical protein VI278_15555 [Nitrososphaeraceae archaeon]
MRQAQLPGVNYVFRKDENGYYTKPALLYQDILRYAIFRKKENPSNDPFTHRDLATWLMSNNREFIDRYKGSSDKHTTINNRIGNTQQRTKDSIKDLVDLGLILKVGRTKIRTGTGTTQTYVFTDIGYLLALIIEGFNLNSRETADNEIYNLYDSNYKRISSPSSYDIFNWALYKKYKEKGVFGSFVVDELRRKFDSNLQTRDIHGLFQRIGVIYSNDIEKATFFVDLWNETLDELKPEDKNLVLHHIKLEIERRMEDRVEDLASFEKTRFDTRNSYDFVAVQGNCKNCKNCYSMGLEIRGYLKIANLLPFEPIIGKCVLCKSDDSYVIKVIDNWD